MAEAGGEAGVSRRTLLNWLLGTSAGALLLAILYPVSRYLVPPGGGEQATGSVTLDVDPASVRPNSGRIFRLGTRPGLLVRTPDGELRAFSAVCTHLGCTVQYRSDLGHIWCACHNGHFDLQGRNIAGPPPRPLETYSVNVRGAQIVVGRSP